MGVNTFYLCTAVCVDLAKSERQAVHMNIVM